MTPDGLFYYNSLRLIFLHSLHTQKRSPVILGNPFFEYKHQGYRVSSEKMGIHDRLLLTFFYLLSQRSYLSLMLGDFFLEPFQNITRLTDREGFECNFKSMVALSQLSTPKILHWPGTPETGVPTLMTTVFSHSNQGKQSREGEKTVHSLSKGGGFLRRQFRGRTLTSDPEVFRGTDVHGSRTWRVGGLDKIYLKKTNFRWVKSHKMISSGLREVVTRYKIRVV